MTNYEKALWQIATGEITKNDSPLCDTATIQKELAQEALGMKWIHYITQENQNDI